MYPINAPISEYITALSTIRTIHLINILYPNNFILLPKINAVGSKTKEEIRVGPEQYSAVHAPAPVFPKCISIIVNVKNINNPYKVPFFIKEGIVLILSNKNPMKKNIAKLISIDKIKYIIEF